MTPGRWLVVVLVIATALTWLNYGYYRHRLEILGFPLDTKDTYPYVKGEPHISEADFERFKQNIGMHSKLDDMKHEVRWMIGRQVALTVFTIGGVWALYLSDKKKTTAG